MRHDTRRFLHNFIEYFNIFDCNFFLKEFLNYYLQERFIRMRDLAGLENNL